MFRALYAFFNLIFLLILFKMFAPGLMELAVSILTNLLVLLNDATSSLSTGSFTTTVVF